MLSIRINVLSAEPVRPSVNMVPYSQNRIYDLIPGEALDELAAVYTYGTIKYTDNNWRKGMKWGRLFGALMRHSWAIWRGEDMDPESGRHHMAHAAWQCLTLIIFCKTHPELDDRVKDL